MLIYRQDAIDAIDMLLEQSEDDEHDKTWNNAIRGSIDAIKHHVTSAQKKGEWIDGVDVPNRNPYIHLANEKYCSECLNEAYWDSDYGQQLFDFCPNCGADMRGVRTQ